jgi:hypothetical protein
MPWWDDGLVGWWTRYPPMNTVLERCLGGFVGLWLRCLTIITVLARCLGGMMAWFVGGFSTLLLILCLQDDLVG